MANKIHKLKTWPEYFAQIVTGKKTFDTRKNDRDFKTGDILNLREWDNKIEQYTGREFNVKVTHIIPGGTFGMAKGHCFMSIEPIPQYKESDNDPESKRQLQGDLIKFAKWVNENLNSSANLTPEEIVDLYMNVK